MDARTRRVYRKTRRLNEESFASVSSLPSNNNDDDNNINRKPNLNNSALEWDLLVRWPCAIDEFSGLKRVLSQLPLSRLVSYKSNKNNQIRFLIINRRDLR